MKRILPIAAALLASGGAVAQSSVTLFGIADVAYTYGSGNGTGSANRSQLTSGSIQTSRLGLRGTEDLSDGYAASFWLEGQVSVDTGNGGTTNTNNQASGAVAAGGLNFGRRSTVSLNAPWGEVRLGRDFTPQALNHVFFDPFNNVGVGASQAFVSSLGGTTLLRASNGVGYLSPSNWGPISAQVQYYLGENPSGTAQSKDGTGVGLRLVYTMGAFQAALAYSKTSFLTGDVRVTNIGGSYTSGNLKLLASYGKDDVAGAAPDGKGGLLGIVHQLGGGEIRGTYTTYKTTANGSPKTDKLAIGYGHNLSKRTQLYVTLARVNNSGGAAVALGGVTTAANQSSNGLDIGIRHSF